MPLYGFWLIATIQSSVHEVDIALCDADGQVIFGMGAIGALFSHALLKPLQAPTLIRYLNEAADITLLSLAEKALICASHNGETFHSEGVKLLLQKFNISPDALICGAHWSLNSNQLD